MLIDDVADQVWKKYNRLVQKRDYRPNLVIYMTQHFWYECHMEFIGEVSSVAMTFKDYNKIFDYEVYPVAKVTRDPNHNSHPSFRIVEV